MKKLTEGERELLRAFELQASRMSNIQAMLEILTDWGPFFDGHFEEDVRRERRMRAVLMLESIGHLAMHYHDEAMGVVDRFYTSE